MIIKISKLKLFISLLIILVNIKQSVSLNHHSESKKLTDSKLLKLALEWFQINKNELLSINNQLLKLKLKLVMDMFSRKIEKNTFNIIYKMVLNEKNKIVSEHLKLNKKILYLIRIG
jgi:hypothetical protein